MTIDPRIMMEFLPYLAQGAIYTVILSTVAIVIGIVVGLIIALMKIAPLKLLRWPATAYTDFFRGTPLLVQLMMLHYGLPQVFHYTPVAWLDAFVGLGLNSAGYVAEIFRAGIESIDRGQTEAARSLGMTYMQAMRYVILPQALRRVLPPLGNEYIALLKDSSLVSIIGMSELMFRARLLNGSTYRPFEAFFTAAILYLVITLPLTQVVAAMERKMSVSDKRA